ncbi:MAG: D-alanyl-D-alanine carboxypeptidase [Clostridia bacterium]|nr:D-alanyl-D-alanine carboxypeptidase [Clostridia bacterium]
MKKAAVFALCLALLIQTPLFLFYSGAEVPVCPDVYAGSYILVEKDDFHVVSSSNEHVRLPVASTTKIMTALVALENADPDDVATVSKNAAATEGSSAYLRAGERVKVKDLLYFLLLQSANDAATALAEHTAGSVGRFADLMNEKARLLGMRDTHFSNPHGLSEADHYSSAYDLALLTVHALAEPSFKKIVSTARYTSQEGDTQRTFVNHNRLLFTLKGCIGVKTGYTLEAGRCLVSACRSGQTTLVCVTLNCKNDWSAHKALYEYGFSKVKRCTLGAEAIDIPLVGAPQKSVCCTYDGCSALSDPEASLCVRIVCPRFLFPPLKEHEPVGYAVYLLDGKEIKRTPIVCAERVDQTPETGWTRRVLSFLTALFHKNE